MTQILWKVSLRENSFWEETEELLRLTHLVYRITRPNKIKSLSVIDKH